MLIKIELHATEERDSKSAQCSPEHCSPPPGGRSTCWHALPDCQFAKLSKVATRSPRPSKLATALGHSSAHHRICLLLLLQDSPVLCRWYDCTWHVQLAARRSTLAQADARARAHSIFNRAGNYILIDLQASNSLTWWLRCQWTLLCTLSSFVFFSRALRKQARHSLSVVAPIELRLSRLAQCANVEQ